MSVSIIIGVINFSLHVRFQFSDGPLQRVYEPTIGVVGEDILLLLLDIQTRGLLLLILVWCLEGVRGLCITGALESHFLDINVWGG